MATPVSLGRYRLSIDFDCVPIDDAHLQKISGDDALSDPDTRELQHAFEALRQSLLRTPDALREYLRKDVITEMEVTPVDDIAQAAGVSLDDRPELQEAVLEPLDATARATFNVLTSDGDRSYSGPNDIFWRSFNLRLVRASVGPIPRLI
jgi:hypothetical protein